MIRKHLPTMIDTYRYVWSHPVGVWLVWIVLLGLGLMSFMMAIYLPVLIERRAMLRDAGAVWVDQPIG